MWEKFIAGILVIVGTQGFGYALCQDMQCRLYHNNQQKELLLYIVREISFLHRPIAEIFEAVSEKIGVPYNEFTHTVARRMNEGNGEELGTIWKEETYKLKNNRCYPKTAIQNLLRIGKCIDCEEDEMQIETLNIIRMELDDDIKKTRCESDEKTRLIRPLSLIAGIFCVVLFL